MKSGIRNTMAAMALAGTAAVVGTAPEAFAQDAKATPYVRSDVQAYLDNLVKNPRPHMNDATIAMIRKIPPAHIAQMMSASEKP